MARKRSSVRLEAKEIPGMRETVSTRDRKSAGVQGVTMCARRVRVSQGAASNAKVSLPHRREKVFGEFPREGGKFRHCGETEESVVFAPALFGQVPALKTRAAATEIRPFVVIRDQIVLDSSSTRFLRFANIVRQV